MIYSLRLTYSLYRYVLEYDKILFLVYIYIYYINYTSNKILCIFVILLINVIMFTVLKTKLVRARMDQKSRKVHISSTMHRTFGKAQWQQLHSLLNAWKNNLAGIQDGMSTVANAQLELVQKQKKF